MPDGGQPLGVVALSFGAQFVTATPLAHFIAA